MTMVLPRMTRFYGTPRGPGVMTTPTVVGSTRLFAKSIFVLIAIVAVFVSVLLVQEEKERVAWEAAPSTLDLYTTDEVCLDPESSNVLNCGQCGPCSNKHDITIYYETRQTLTETMTSCGSGDLLFGRSAFDCLKQAVAMTDGCTACWVLNYQCNIQNCVMTCLKERFFPFLPSLTSWNSEPLTPCIACDEKLCGPTFVGCAGANRRRTGIVSDLQRDAGLEICDKVDWDWMLSDSKLSSINKNN